MRTIPQLLVLLLLSRATYPIDSSIDDLRGSVRERVLIPDEEICRFVLSADSHQGIIIFLALLKPLLRLICKRKVSVDSFCYLLSSSMFECRLYQMLFIRHLFFGSLRGVAFEGSSSSLVVVSIVDSTAIMMAVMAGSS